MYLYCVYTVYLHFHCMEYCGSGNSRPQAEKNMNQRETRKFLRMHTLTGGLVTKRLKYPPRTQTKSIHTQTKLIKYIQFFKLLSEPYSMNLIAFVFNIHICRYYFTDVFAGLKTNFNCPGRYFMPSHLCISFFNFTCS